MYRNCLIFAGFTALSATGAGAQVGGTTGQQIERAKQFYQAFNVEAAQPILLNIVSPGYLQPVSASERVETYKYLGASYALQGKVDSAQTFFIAALDFDPFTDLDPREFSATELGPFNDAKAAIFKVGLRPILDRVIDPGSDSTAYNFRIITTQRAVLNVELVRQDNSQVSATLYSGESQGPRTIPWRGVLSSGEFADSTTYIVRARAQTVGPNAGQEITTQHLLRVEHSFAPLEDTLPTFQVGAELLQEEYPARAPWFDLVKAAAMAGTAVALPYFALTDDLTNRATHSFVAGGLGALAGGISFTFRRQNRSIPDNVRENERRRQQRNTFNAGVRQRNAERLQQRKLIVTAIAGISG